MRVRQALTCTAAVALLATPLLLAQGAAPAGQRQAAPPATDANRVVAGGGISVPGWMGVLDPRDIAAGQTVSGAKLAPEGAIMRVTTGPAITYWNPANRATGDYTVKATFNEPKFQNVNDHPHPYGVVIAGNDMGTPTQSYLYCAAYGNGNFIVRGFGSAAAGTPSAVFNMNGRGGPNAAVHKAAAIGQPVTQEIALSVKGDKVSCNINGTEVWASDKATLVVPGKLKSTDGLYGFRFAHNTDATVGGLSMTK